VIYQSATYRRRLLARLAYLGIFRVSSVCRSHVSLTQYVTQPSVSRDDENACGTTKTVPIYRPSCPTGQCQGWHQEFPSQFRHLAISVGYTFTSKEFLLSMDNNWSAILQDFLQRSLVQISGMLLSPVCMCTIIICSMHIISKLAIADNNVATGN